MPIKSITNSLDFFTCSKDSKIPEIAKIMEEEKISTVVVQEDGHPIGIITDRKLALCCINNNLNIIETSAEEVMSFPVKTISEEAGVLELVEAMSDEEVRRICVINNQNIAVGIISLTDIFELLVHEMGHLSIAIGETRGKLLKRKKSQTGAA